MKYTGEIIQFQGENFAVIDTGSIDFSKAQIGVKNKITKVVLAKGGEKITTKNGNGEIESVVVAISGDAIFCNSENDMYIPTSSDGTHYKYDNIETYGYTIQEKGDDYVFVRSNNKALLLVGCIEKNSAIKNAFGNGVHQFLYKGATLKKDLKTGTITGIDKQAFETTWTILYNK